MQQLLAIGAMRNLRVELDAVGLRAGNVVSSHLYRIGTGYHLEIIAYAGNGIRMRHPNL